jgi:uncharacterized protein (TIGR03000 family)
MQIAEPRELLQFEGTSMCVKKSLERMPAVLALAIILTDASALPAQLMSKWGHPAFTIGSTPYDSVNQGHGNYPGGPGFIPGYGYYPGSGPNHYPWLDGPGTPFDRRKIVGESPPGTPVGECSALSAADLRDTALVIVKLPDEAELWFDGSKTAQSGSYRTFRTPPLPSGQAQSYSVQVRWRIKDAVLSRSETVEVAPGGVFMVDFLTADSWTGIRARTTPGEESGPIQELKPPRRLPDP